jgi:DNA-binding PadR family transcriptional regulator
MASRLNATAASLLGFLHEGPLAGWDLVATAEQRIGDFWSLTRSQVYRELAAMAEQGLVVAGRTGPRERRPYRITAAGRKAFRAWIESEPADEQIRYPLLLTLAFGRHLEPEVLAAFVRSHRERHRARLEGYRDDPYANAVLDFGIRYEEAVLGWFDALPPELGGAG